MIGKRLARVYWPGVVILFFVALGVAGPASSALAHRVTIFAWVQDGVIHTESKFSGGKKVRDGAVLVYDPRDNLLLEGTTDASGEFSFKAPMVADLRIVLKAAMGHRNEWIVRADEISPEGASQRQHASLTGPAGGEAAPPARGSASVADIQAMEDLLDKKLAPLIKKLNQLQADRDPTLKDILGGIGYILGLMGVGVFVRFRRLEKGRVCPDAPTDPDQENEI